MDLNTPITGVTGTVIYNNGAPWVVRDVLRDALLSRSPADEDMSDADKAAIASLLAALDGSSLSATTAQKAMLLDRVARFNPPYVVDQVK